MKVVLFCGGLGTRLKEYSETIPKPMVDIGYRPIMWHLMRYYAHFGHTEFILCLGYRGDVIKNYFLNYNECLSNDFTMKDGGKTLQLYNHDIDDWSITFAETGLNSNLGQRLMAVRPYLKDDEYFMANYTDGLADLDLNTYINNFKQKDKTACFLAAKPSQTFHVTNVAENGDVTSIQPVLSMDLWINVGFFIFRNDIFNYMRPGEELVVQPFNRLIEQNQLMAQKHAGFWACMDTLKEKKLFDDMYASGNTPWTLWDNGLNGKSRIQNTINASQDMVHAKP
jgi:glucose-1-phosphate cytidylyltransferase